MNIFVASVLFTTLLGPCLARHGRTRVLNLIGTGAMYEGMVPDIDGDGVDDPAMCFDVDLMDPRRGRKIGTATDCLSNVVDDEPDGLQLVGTTYFNFGAKVRGEVTRIRWNGCSYFTY